MANESERTHLIQLPRGMALIGWTSDHSCAVSWLPDKGEPVWPGSIFDSHDQGVPSNRLDAVIAWVHEQPRAQAERPGDIGSSS
jgi:hypothetical protein